MKKKSSENFLERKPKRGGHLTWKQEENGNVTLEIENKGWMNRICQKLFKKPPITYIHFDEMGSFLWPLLDGKKDIIALGEMVEEKFGEEAHPLYERLAQYFRILESYGFIEWNKD